MPWRSFGLNPGAVISSAVRGEAAPLPDLTDADAEPLPPLIGEGEPIVATPLTLDPDVDWTAFALWLSALLHARGNDLVRVKGVVPTPAGRLLLQTVRKVVQQPEILPNTVGSSSDGTVVFLGRGYRPETLRASLRRFTDIR